MVVRSHYVATGYIYDSSADSFLLVLHKKMGKWLPPGGHLDQGEEPHKGVLRELWEEIGVQGRVLNLLATPDVATPSTAQLPSPFCILYETIPSAPEDEEHMHIDFVYALAIDVSQPLHLLTKEVLLAEWISAAHIDRIDTYENVKQVCRAISSLGRESKA